MGGLDQFSMLTYEKYLNNYFGNSPIASETSECYYLIPAIQGEDTALL